MNLFRRAWRVTAGVLDVSALRVAFTVERTLAPQPNTCELRVYNLRRDNTIFSPDVPISIEAGYESGTSLIFSGTVRTAITARDGADVITFFGAGDGEQAYRSSRINVSIAKGTKVDAVLRQLVSALGVASGNVDSAVVQVKLSGLSTVFMSGTSLSGSASKEMTAVCRSCGLSWSVQNGELQILPLGAAVEGLAVKLSGSTGLVGSPSVDGKGVLTARTLMIPDLVPGRVVAVDAEFVQGNYRVEKARYIGDSHGEDWHIEIEGKTY